MLISLSGNSICLKSGGLGKRLTECFRFCALLLISRGDTRACSPFRMNSEGAYLLNSAHDPANTSVTFLIITLHAQVLFIYYIFCLIFV